MTDDRWIPVGERLPTKEGWYTATLEHEQGRIVDDVYFYTGFLKWRTGSPVIAWRELPEPYRGEGA